MSSAMLTIPSLISRKQQLRDALTGRFTKAQQFASLTSLGIGQRIVSVISFTLPSKLTLFTIALFFITMQIVAGQEAIASRSQLNMSSLDMSVHAYPRQSAKSVPLPSHSPNLVTEEDVPLPPSIPPQKLLGTVK
jgi:hypothetical protein